MKTRHHILLSSKDISKLNISPQTMQALNIMVLKKQKTKKSYLTEYLLTF